MIYSAMATGNGAYTVHELLSREIPDYQLTPYSPKLEYSPFLIPLLFRPPQQTSLVHTTPDNGFLIQSSRSPLVITFHNYVLDKWMADYSTAVQRLHYATDLRWLIKKSVKKAAHITAVSQFTADLVREAFGSSLNIEVIPNGIDIKRFSMCEKREQDAPVKVLFCGNLSRRKGVQWLPEIIERLDKSIEVWIAGSRSIDKSKMPWLDKPQVKLLGSLSTDEMPELYRQVDILLLPTVREGLSMAVLEGMASGLPVVASDCSSMPELVESGKGGHLCRVGAGEEFAEAINSLANNSGLRQSMGVFNRAKVEKNYAVEAMVARYQALFDSVQS